jgi:hypothetical protein
MGPPNQSLPTQHLNDEAGPSTQAIGPELANTQESKKRKPNANGPRQSAPCWEFFIRLPDNEVEIPTAVCKLCHKRYLCHPRFHGTSNMNTHILKCPQILALKASRANQTLLSFPTVEGAGLTTVSSRFNQLACRKALATYIILDEQPFKTVEGEGFKHFSRTMQPLFNIPTRKTIANDCFQLYMDEKRILKAFFKTDCGRVALTTDCWTSIQNLNYLTLTAHFVDNEWNYQKRIISFTVIPNHKGDTVGRKIEEVLRDWGIRSVSSITVDNASSNDVAIAYLKKKVKTMNGLMGDGDCFHMRCCSHILNLVVTDGLKDKHLSVTSIREAVRFVKSSPQRAAKFKECIEFAGITCKKLVCLDVSTRWNSAYLMLEAAERFQVAFEKLEDDDSSFREFFGVDGPPMNIDWENARAFSRFLQLFYEATKLFSASQHVSIHTAFYQISSIFCELKRASMDLNSVFATVGVDMMAKYTKYWGNIANMNKLLYYGTILDPRFKMSYIEWIFKEMYGDKPLFAEKLIKSIRESLNQLYSWYKNAYDQTISSGQPLPSVLENVSYEETTSAAARPSFMARADAFEQHLEQQNSIDLQNELDGYINSKCVKRTDNFDILMWWKHNSAQYPILSTMAKDILAIPVSTVASESAFSTGGRVIETYRSSLKPEMAEALICTQNWLKPSFTYFKDLNFMEEVELSEDVVTGINMFPLFLIGCSKLIFIYLYITH